MKRNKIKQWTENFPNLQKTQAMTPKFKFCNQLQGWKYSKIPAKKRNKSVKHARKCRKCKRKIENENKRQ